MSREPSWDGGAPYDLAAATSSGRVNGSAPTTGTYGRCTDCNDELDPQATDACEVHLCVECYPWFHAQMADEDGDPEPLAQLREQKRTLLFEQEVTEQKRRLHVRQEAARRLNADQAAARPIPVVLRELLTQPDDETLYRVDRLLPANGRAMLAAPYKAGKSTLTGNLIRSLADGDPFLGSFDVVPPEGTIAVFDNELYIGTIRRWLRDQGIRNTDRVVVIPLRGAVSSFNIIDPDVRAEWAATLRSHGTTFALLDCFRPLIDSLGLSEDKDAGKVLVAFDELLAAANVPEALVVHHAGHGGERARGDSRLRDWPDVEWRIVRQDVDDPASPRFFTAFGRDVDVPETALTYDPTTRHLTLGEGNRREAAAAEHWPALRDYLQANPGLSGRAIEKGLTPDEMSQKQFRDAQAYALKNNLMHRVGGPCNAKLCYLSGDPSASVRSSASPVRQHSESECVSASLGDALHTHVDQAQPEQDQRNALTCPRCQQPSKQLIQGRCEERCAYPTGRNEVGYPDHSDIADAS